MHSGRDCIAGAAALRLDLSKLVNDHNVGSVIKRCRQQRRRVRQSASIESAPVGAGAAILGEPRYDSRRELLDLHVAFFAIAHEFVELNQARDPQA